MRIRSGLTTAAAILLASTALVAAQGMQKQGPAGEGGPGPGQMQNEGQQGKQPPQKSDRRENVKQDNGKQKGAAQVEEKEGTPKQQQGKQQNQKEQRAEPKGKADERSQAQKGERTEGQKGERTEGQKGERTEGQKGERAEGQKGERNDAQKGERTDARGDKTLTVEQKTRVRETVLRGGNAPRVTKSNITFSISVGTAVPRSVRVVELPPLLIEYYPAWRGYLYFVVDDEIIIVDRDYRIIAVLEV